MDLHNINRYKFELDKSFETYSLDALSNTALFIVDMNNGFTREGALSSPRVAVIIPEVKRITDLFIRYGKDVIAFTDSHDLKSAEFNEYPVHCLKGTRESRLVDELLTIEDKMTIIEKNSTNGMVEEETQKAVEKLIDNGCCDFVVTGCCTDICVSNFAMTLKCYLNKRNVKGRVIVPLNAVETFDAPSHPGDVMNAIAIKMMIQNGIYIVKNII